MERRHREGYERDTIRPIFLRGALARGCCGLTPAPPGSVARCPAGGSGSVCAWGAGPRGGAPRRGLLCGSPGRCLCAAHGATRPPPELEIAASTFLRSIHAYILALSAERVSRHTDIWVEPPTLENIFDEEREVRALRRS